MAITGTFTWTQQNKHIVSRTSNVKATDAGHIYDLINTAAAVDNGTNAKVGAQVGTELSLRTYAVPAAGDKIVFVSDVPLLYPTYTSLDQAEYNFTNRKGKEFRAYELVEDDVIGFSDYGFTTLVNSTTGPQKGNLVVVDGAGKWEELASNATTSTYGFIGEIIGFEKYQFDTVVLVRVKQNKTV